MRLHGGSREEPDDLQYGGEIDGAVDRLRIRHSDQGVVDTGLEGSGARTRYTRMVGRGRFEIAGSVAVGSPRKKETITFGFSRTRRR